MGDNFSFAATLSEQDLKEEKYTKINPVREPELRAAAWPHHEG